MVYKFKPINKWLLESLVNSTVYVPSHKGLNDPFDCQIDIDYLFEKSIQYSASVNENFAENKLRDNDFKATWMSKVSEVGVYSVSIDETVLYQTLMWSYYANNHTGACIKYNSKFINYINSIIPKEDGGAVDYTEANMAERIAMLPRKEPFFSNGLTRLYLFSKSNQWKYEREGRFILSRPTTLTLPEKHIESIYFGINSSDSDVNLIKKLARSYSGCETFYKARRKGYYDISFDEIQS